jgi:hypothetical protein
MLVPRLGRAGPSRPALPESTEATVPHPYAQHAKARHEAFSWYDGTPPSIDKARRHFGAKAERDPEHRALYAEALDIFLATCWKIPPPA